MNPLNVADARPGPDPAPPPPDAPAAASTKLQFLMTFAIIGCVGPFLPVLLAERGLSRDQIGYVSGVASFAVIVTPVIATLLADVAIAGRYLIAAVYALAGLFLALLLPQYGFWPVLGLYTLHMFAIQPAIPLQDGIHFAAQAARKARGLPEVPYHTVRVWGTVGYMVPGVILYFFLKPGEPMTPTLWCGVIFSLAGALYALFMLPHTPRPPRDPSKSTLPTIAAAKVLFQPRVLAFCMSMFILQVGSAAYYLAFPLHLVERSGLDKRWVGMVANVGVALEIVYILAFGYLVKRLTVRRLVYIGTIAIVVRMVALGLTGSAAVAIGSQLIHGLTVLASNVVPPLYLNAHAEDRYRNSIQGLYTMVFSGAGRVIGYSAAGMIAGAYGLPTCFYVASGLCLAAMGLFPYAFGKEKVVSAGADC